MRMMEFIQAKRDCVFGTICLGGGLALLLHTCSKKKRFAHCMHLIVLCCAMPCAFITFAFYSYYHRHRCIQKAAKKNMPFDKNTIIRSCFVVFTVRVPFYVGLFVCTMLGWVWFGLDATFLFSIVGPFLCNCSFRCANLHSITYVCIFFSFSLCHSFKFLSSFQRVFALY